ncbi:MAG: hypothetical protein GX437_01580 [Sphingobacteriales bacterium]|nr:hypothetical protein [Sphingobacteriales bacterium]
MKTLFPVKLKKTITLFLILLPAFHSGYAQLARNWIPESELSFRLDSIRKSDGVEKHFAEIYLMATIAADRYIATLPDTPKMLLNRLQAEFARRFFESIDGRNNGHIPVVWTNYYTYTGLNDLQFKLIGTNGHINGDSWQVLFNYFNPYELQYIEPYYNHCTEALQVVLDSLHVYGCNQNKRLYNLHRISFGLDKAYARHLLRKWRERQYKVAVSGYENHNRFLRMQMRIKRRVKYTDYLIRHLLI